MGAWGRFFDWSSSGRSQRNRHHYQYRDEMRRLLPSNSNDVPTSAMPAKEVTKVALRLKYHIESVVSCELDESLITKANSPVVTRKVVQLAKEAGGKEYGACVLYCLLVCNRWFKRQSMLELWDADLHDVRAVAAEMIAKHIIENEEDEKYLLLDCLLKRYSIMLDGEETEPVNAVERAVDLHALHVIGSSGYQKCIKHLWRGWLSQDDKDPSNFIEYKDKASQDYWTHFNPDRMRTPVYQNVVQVSISLIYLATFTGAINTINRTGDLDVVEGIVYLFTFGFLCDEGTKFYKIGRYYFGFWNGFNLTLYGLLTISFVLRIIALSHSPDTDDEKRRYLNEMSYNFLAITAPLFWGRLLLYLDTFRFFGAMLVVLNVMMKESLIFFALLAVVIVGFLQAFIGLDQIDNDKKVTSFILQAMANSVMQSPEFDGFENFAPPFGLVLYYIFTFVVMVILLNVLIALYNSAYEDITENATDEYMALFSAKTMQFVRAPDENVFIAPFNLIEIFLLIIPLEWWMDTHRYERLNNFIMGIIYSPLLLITAIFEVRTARHVNNNRRRGEEDDDRVEEWEQMDDELDFETEGWTNKVESVKPNVETEAAVVAVKELKELVKELQEEVKRLAGDKGESADAGNGGPS